MVKYPYENTEVQQRVVDRFEEIELPRTSPSFKALYSLLLPHQRFTLIQWGYIDVPDHSSFDGNYYYRIHKEGGAFNVMYISYPQKDTSYANVNDRYCAVGTAYYYEAQSNYTHYDQILSQYVMLSTNQGMFLRIANRQ